MKRLFYIINFALAVLLPLFSFNIIVNRSDPNQFFPFIFICLGFCDTFLGINLLNANKKILSISSFILAGFFFILVGTELCIYN